jgi:hypothetical protein
VAKHDQPWELYDISNDRVEANDLGRFTAFIGFEWTSNTSGNNLHRNIIFRDGATRASLVEPYTTQKPYGSDNPRDLWKWMSAYEQKTGGHVLAIAHNGNLSNGRMFPLIESFTGKPIDRDYDVRLLHLVGERAVDPSAGVQVQEGGHRHVRGEEEPLAGGGELGAVVVVFHDFFFFF